MKYSLLALAVVAAWSVSVQAAELKPIGGQTEAAAAPQAVQPAAAGGAVPAKTDKVNPFTGQTLSNEQTQRDLENYRMQSQVMAEKLKLRKDELEMLKLDDQAKKLKEPKLSEVEKKKPDGFESDKKVAEAKKKRPAKPRVEAQVNSGGNYAAMAPMPKPKEPIAYFTPPASRNISEPKLIGVLQVDDRKVAVLSYNGVVVRIPEGGVVANKAITSVGNGKVMWGNRPLYTTGFVEGPKIIITDVPATNTRLAGGAAIAQPAPAAPVSNYVQNVQPASPFGTNAASPVFKLPPPPPPVSAAR